MLFYLPYLWLILFVPLTTATITLTAFKGSTKKTPPALDDFSRPHDPQIGPKGMSYNKTTSCQEFGKYARFNPHSVVGIKWFVFFYWSSPEPNKVYTFWIPGKKDLKLLHYALDGHLPSHFKWNATLVLKRELLSNITSLLEERGDRGQYLEYSIYQKIPSGTITDYKEIRIKQTGDNKYLGMMNCKKRTASIMSNLHDVPPQNKLQDEAAKLGFRSRRGKSYLYQGHEWMPVSEIDEKEFWAGQRNLNIY